VPATLLREHRNNACHADAASVFSQSTKRRNPKRKRPKIDRPVERFFGYFGFGSVFSTVIISFLFLTPTLDKGSIPSHPHTAAFTFSHTTTMPIHDDHENSTVSIGAKDTGTDDLTRTDNDTPAPVPESTHPIPPPSFTRRTVKSLTAKRVCFSAGVRCRLYLHINDFTDEECFGTYYQQDEYDRMMIELIHYNHHHQKRKQLLLQAPQR
jgi:hypothetical protein